MSRIGWATPGGAHGVEVYTRVSLYLFTLLQPFFYLNVVVAYGETPSEPPGLPVALTLVVAAVTHTVLCFAVVHVGFDETLFEARRPRALVVAMLAAGGIVVVLAVLFLPSYGRGGLMADPRTIMIGVTGAATLGALAVRVRYRRVAAWAVTVPAAVVAGRVLSPGPSGDMGELVPVALGAYVFALLWSGTLRMSMWILEVVRELDGAREVSARLAVAEERLRISRDMHDVVGRALATVAVKSELAAELARRGEDRAVAEMQEVRSLAQESLREVRGVVAGYRAADLATELAGARSVLRSAGIAARVEGDVPDLDVRRQEALAWVVREAVTNVVRHSAASECVLHLGQDAHGTTLRITNDGVRRATSGTDEDGSGIAGLAERLAAVGGTVTARPDGDRFVLEARVPAVVASVELGTRA